MVRITYRAPFSLRPVTVLDHKQSKTFGKQGNPNERRLYVDRTTRSLTSWQTLLDLSQRIFKAAFKNFFLGKSLVYAGFLVGDEIEAYAIPESRPPIPGNERLCPSQPELARVAMETKEIERDTDVEAEDQLAVPILAEKTKELLGVLVFSNRLTFGTKKFKKNDVNVARALAEKVAIAMSKKMQVAQ